MEIWLGSDNVDISQTSPFENSNTHKVDLYWNRAEKKSAKNPFFLTVIKTWSIFAL